MHPGVLEPIGDPETWQRAQTFLDTGATASERRRKREHYLKRDSYWGSCQSRLLLGYTSNKQDIRYAHYICTGRATKCTICTRKAAPVGVAGQFVAKNSTNTPPSPRAAIRSSQAGRGRIRSTLCRALPSHRLRHHQSTPRPHPGCHERRQSTAGYGTTRLRRPPGIPRHRTTTTRRLRHYVRAHGGPRQTLRQPNLLLAHRYHRR